MLPYSQRNFNVEVVLRHEAEALSNHSPSRGKPLEPECNFGMFTRLRNFGAGVCRVKQWPDDEDPYIWGRRNKVLLLNEPIFSPASWEVEDEYRGRFKNLLRSIDHTYLGSFRDSDEGYEEQLMVVLNNILRRVTAIAFIFLIQLWRRKPEHSSHPDYLVVFEAMHNFSVQQIRTEDRRSSQSHALAVMVPRFISLQPKQRCEECKPMVIG